MPFDFVGHVARRGEGTEGRGARRAAEASEDRNAAAKIRKQSGARGRRVERRGEWRKGAEKASDVRDGAERRGTQRVEKASDVDGAPQ